MNDISSIPIKMNQSSFKVGLAQRVLASYRIPLFDVLSETFDGQFSVYAGQPRPDEMIDCSKKPQKAVFWPADNIHLLGGKAYFCLQTDILKWLRSWNPDVLILEANQRYLMLPAAVSWMHRRGRKVIGWGLGTGSVSKRTASGFLKKFDAMLTYSTAGKESYCSAGYPPEKIFIARNAAVRRPAGAIPIRSSAAFSGRPIVLYVGRLQERKRVDLLISACAAQPDMLKPDLWIIGDGPVRKSLEEKAAAVYPETKFLGARYGDELKAFFDKADLFVLPGTGGLALQQAMASALPLISAEADGTQNDLVRKENGRIVQPGNLLDLTQAISGILSNVPRLRAMGNESYRIVSEEINLETMAETIRQAVFFTQGK